MSAVVDLEPAVLEEVRSWLRANADRLTPARPHPGDPLELRIRRGAALLEALERSGLTYRGWPRPTPREVGSTGDRVSLGDPVARAAVYDAITREGYDLPEQVAALEVVGPALLRFAPALAARDLPAMLGGGAIWCQGFSEPDAGSDLAALRTSARRLPDGGWRLSGQKVWTSLAHVADRCAVLARTEDTPRHRGLTMFWVDLATAGVTVRPLRALTGEEEYAEVFFDEVHLPPDCVIGPVAEGWQVAMFMLQYERGMWAWQRQARLLASLDRGDLGDRVGHREAGDRLLDVYAVRLRSRATVRRLAAGEEVGPEASVDKVLLASAEHSVRDSFRDHRGVAFGVGDDDDMRALRAEWFYSRAASVYGGAVDIQRNIVAERLLGLPREP